MSEPDIAAIACQVIDDHGGTAAFAKKLGMMRQRVHHWRRTGFPLTALPVVVEATGMRPEHLRPDQFRAKAA